MSATDETTTDAPTEEPSVEGEVVEAEEPEVALERNSRRDYREMTHTPGVALARGGDRMPMELTADDLVARLDKLHEAAEKALNEGVDFGTIPGTDKPSLYKPGAEKLCMLFMLDPETDIEERYDAEGHLSVLARTVIYHAPTGVRLGSGVGSCTTRETRYCYRNSQLTCPDCGAENLRKSKNDPEFYCWQKTGGCGATFPLDDERITSQVVGKIARPVEELADYYNTVLKMARKRSLIDAVLVTTGASHIYTQDVEDAAPEVQPTVKRDVAAEGFPIPRSWAAIKEAIIGGYGEALWPPFEEHVARASEALFGSRDSKELTKEQRMVMLQKSAGAAARLRDEVVGDFPPPTDEQIAAAFAAVIGHRLDGAEAEGGEPSGS